MDAESLYLIVAIVSAGASVLSFLVAYLYFRKEFPSEQLRRLEKVESSVVALEQGRMINVQAIKLIQNDIGWMRTNSEEISQRLAKLDDRLTNLLDNDGIHVPVKN